MLERLPHQGVATRLGVSKIHGVGVFAIEAIDKDTKVFAHDQGEIHWINASEIKAACIHPQLRAFYQDFAIRQNGMLGCPASFDLLTPGWYVNQPENGETANLRASADFQFFASRDIQPDEELTVAYSTFSA